MTGNLKYVHAPRLGHHLVYRQLAERSADHLIWWFSSLDLRENFYTFRMGKKILEVVPLYNHMSCLAISDENYRMSFYMY